MLTIYFYLHSPSFVVININIVRVNLGKSWLKLENDLIFKNKLKFESALIFSNGALQS